MNFGKTPEPEAPPAIHMPELRTFIVRRFEPVQERQGVFVIEEIRVNSHSVAVEGDGVLSFVLYLIWEGQVIPQKHRIFSSYVDMEEQVEFHPQHIITH